MGWSSGGDLADKIEQAMKPYLKKFTAEELDAIGRKIADAFEDHDADTLTECDGFIGHASANMSAERYGAPSKPWTKGDGFKNKYGEQYRYDGDRWRYVQDE